MLRSEDYGFAKGEENTGAISEQMGSEAMPEISGNRELSDAEIQERSENMPLREESAISPAQDQNYRNYIVRYSQNIYGSTDYESDRTFQIINERFGIIYTPAERAQATEFNSYTYSSVPKCYTYMDLGGLSASGINRLHEHPYLQLRGKGTLVAVIDSGIDYRHPAFRNGNQSKILGIWDQSLPGDGSDKVPFGRFFSGEEISRALESENPLNIVPSVDTNGHGTSLAATAAGNSMPEEEFSGAAPEADLLIVKLKPAKEYLREFYLIPPEAEVFQEDDIMLGISFAVKFATENRMPISVCLGLGTSQGSHRGESPLCHLIDSTSNLSQNAVSTARETRVSPGIIIRRCWILPGPQTKLNSEWEERKVKTDFPMEFWGDSPELYSLSVESPTGERLEVSTALNTEHRSFLLCSWRQKYR